MRDKLSNVIDIISGGTPKTSEERFWNGDIGWLSLVDFGSKNKYVETSEKTITQEGVDNSSTKVLQENDIIISARGTVGAMAMLKKPMAFNQSCFGLRAKPQYLNQDYLFYYLKYYMKSIKAKVQGSVFDTINLATFDMLEIEYPQMCIQNRIANILGAIDNKIENNNKINIQLELMAQTIYNYWFLQFEFPNEEGKPYKSSGGKMVWNEELKREIPESWEARKIDDFGTLSNGINYDKDANGNKEYKIVNVRNISSTSLLMDKVDMDDIYLDSKLADKFLVKENDILIARSGIPGAVRILEGDIKNTIYCGFIICFELSSDFWRKYLVYKLKDYEDTTATTSGGTIMQNVSQHTLKDIKFAVPNKKSILLFNDKIEAIWSVIQKNNRENRELISLREFLLPLLMNGQVGLKYNWKG